MSLVISSISKSLPLTVTAAVAVTGGFAWWLGLLDRPPFVAKDTLFHRSTTTTKKAKNKCLYVIAAFSNDKNFAKVIPALVMDTLEAIELGSGRDQREKIKVKLAQAARDYGSSGPSLNIGVYFDDPAATDKPRYAIGWAIAADTVAEAQAIATAASDYHRRSKQENESSASTPFCKMIRIPTGPVLTASIPWRHMLTPAIAPMLHWGRAYQAYVAGGYKTPGPARGIVKPQERNEIDGNVACEFYVTGPSGAKDQAATSGDEQEPPCPGKNMVAIDYTILMSDTTELWNDSYPENN